MVYTLLGQLPDLLQIPFELSASLIFVYQSIGLFVLPGILLYIVAIALTTYANEYRSRLSSEIRIAGDSRIQHVTEAFKNVKTYKLYGWICRFCDHMRKEYLEELQKK